MYCTQCGMALGPGDKFCSKCGAVVPAANGHSTTRPDSPDTRIGSAKDASAEWHSTTDTHSSPSKSFTDPQWDNDPKSQAADVVEPYRASDTQTQNLYEAFLGEKNRSYYLTKFAQFDKQGLGLNTSWNWPAFFFTGFWALYRKMYGWFFAFWGIAFLSNVFEKAGSSGLSTIIFLVPWIAFAIYANSLYHNSINKKIAVAQLTIKEEPKLLEYLRHKGGVHTWVIWVFGLITAVGILAAIAIPAYNDYLQRMAGQHSQQPVTEPTGRDLLAE